MRVNLTAALRAYRQKANKQPGREQMDRMIAQLPAEQLTDLGVMYEREGRLDDAVRAYRAALQRDFYYVRANVNMGNVARKQGRPEEARGWYRQALVVDPASFEAANNFADLCAEDGTSVDEAISRLMPVMGKAGPLHPYALDTLGWLYHRKGEDELARQSLAAALAETEADNRDLRATVHGHLAVVCKALGRTDEAEGHEAQARGPGE